LPEASDVRPGEQPFVRKKRTSWLIPAVLGILISLIALQFAVKYFSGNVSALLHSVGSPASGADLQFHLQPQDDRVLITWPHDPFASEPGSQAILDIQDGAKSRKLYLDHEQLALGSILYKPISPEVQFRFAISDGKGPVIQRTLKFIDGTRSVMAPVTNVAARP
jgi:hypothetical protein